MTTWVLLIFVALPVYGGRSPAVTTVPGYQSKDACLDAAAELVGTQDAVARVLMGIVCFPGPERSE